MNLLIPEAKHVELNMNSESVVSVLTLSQTVAVFEHAFCVTGQ